MSRAQWIFHNLNHMFETLSISIFIAFHFVSIAIQYFMYSVCQFHYQKFSDYSGVFCYVLGFLLFFKLFKCNFHISICNNECCSEKINFRSFDVKCETLLYSKLLVVKRFQIGKKVL